MTKEEFIQEIGNTNLTIAKFGASWCGPCRLVKPIFEQMANDNADIRFIEIDIDENDDIATEYGIMNIPTILFFKDGDVVDMMVGMQSKDILKKKIENLRNF